MSNKAPEHSTLITEVNLELARQSIIESFKTNSPDGFVRIENGLIDALDKLHKQDPIINAYDVDSLLDSGTMSTMFALVDILEAGGLITVTSGSQWQDACDYARTNIDKL